MKGVNKIIGLGFICIASFVYMSRWALNVWLCSSVTGWRYWTGPDGQTLRSAHDTSGVLALVALIVGILYLASGAIARFRNRAKKSE